MPAEVVLKGSTSVPDEELEPTFLQGMVNRRIQGFRKYGSAIETDRFARSDRAANIRERLKMYEETHNTEWLMDAAVFAWIEFVNPSYEDAYYRATGNDESPGAIMKDGKRFHGHAARDEAARIAYKGRDGD